MGEVKAEDIGECGERREVDFGSGKRVEEENRGRFFEDKKPAVRGAAAAAARRLGEVEVVEFVVGEIKEGTAVDGGTSLREH